MPSARGDHVYKKIELTGSSTTIAKASLSLRDIRWFEVVETRGLVEHGKVAYWQVTIKGWVRFGGLIIWERVASPPRQVRRTGHYSAQRLKTSRLLRALSGCGSSIKNTHPEYFY
jgi:flavin-binding protein dodecin